MWVFYNREGIWKHCADGKRRQKHMILWIQETVQDPQDQEFILRLYQDHHRLMFFVANKSCSDPYDSEEVVQETLLKLIQKVGVLRGMDPNARLAYVSVAVRNTAYSMLRRKSADSKRLVPLPEERDTIPSPELSLEENMILLERKEKLLEIWDLLSPEDRFILEGRYLLQYSAVELAEELGCQPSTVRMKLTRARRRALRKMLENYEGVKNV